MSSCEQVQVRLGNELQPCFSSWMIFCIKIESEFSQMHRIRDIYVIANFVFRCICSLFHFFAPYDISNCEIRCRHSKIEIGTLDWYKSVKRIPPYKIPALNPLNATPTNHCARHPYSSNIITGIFQRRWCHPQLLFWPVFSKNCMEMKRIGARWGNEHSLAPPS